MKAVHETYFERLTQKLKSVYEASGFGFNAFENKEMATHFILSKIAKDDVITFGGSFSIKEIGLLDKIKNGGYTNFFDRDTQDKDKKKEAEIKAFSSDVYLASANAITKDGIVVNIDGTGNRVAAILYGPKKVFLVVGANKLVENEEEGFKRAKNIAASYNSIRFSLDNPCAVDMSCSSHCNIETSLCSYKVSIAKCMVKGRIHIIFVNTSLGY